MGHILVHMGQAVIGSIDVIAKDNRRPILAVKETLSASHHVVAHHHTRGQLLCPMSGLAMASTGHGNWAVPCRRALWIPPGVQHEIRFEGVQELQNLYFAKALTIGMPKRCQVFSISSFMRSLMREAVSLPVRYDLDRRSIAIMELLGFELAKLRELPLSLPLPQDRSLLKMCVAFSMTPNASEGIDDWANALHMTRRTFTRLFRRETGLSFVSWRQQACILASLPMLVAGAPVTQIAADLGYENLAAFSGLFKRVLGIPPREYAQTLELTREVSVREEIPN